jgi:hypothetical protein
MAQAGAVYLWKASTGELRHYESQKREMNINLSL